MAAWLGARRTNLGRCASTNDVAAAAARAGAVHGAVFVADEQTAGRGRQGHSWHSPAGENLYLSCLLRPELRPHQVPPITLAAGIATCEAVNSAGVQASLKWPNDVLVGSRKLAGVLTEMSTRGDRVEYVIPGIGVNLNTTDFPGELAASATSLRAARGGGRVDPAGFLEVLLPELEAWFDRFLAGGVAAVADAWLERASTKPIRATAGSATVEGRAVGLEPDGALILEDAAGQRHRVVAGDVDLLRSPGDAT